MIKQVPQQGCCCMAVRLCSDGQAASACSSSCPAGLSPAALSEQQTGNRPSQSFGQTRPSQTCVHLYEVKENQ